MVEVGAVAHAPELGDERNPQQRRDPTRLEGSENHPAKTERQHQFPDGTFRGPRHDGRRQHKAAVGPEAPLPEPVRTRNKNGSSGDAGQKVVKKHRDCLELHWNQKLQPSSCDQAQACEGNRPPQVAKQQPAERRSQQVELHLDLKAPRRHVDRRGLTVGDVVDIEQAGKEVGKLLREVELPDQHADQQIRRHGDDIGGLQTRQPAPQIFPQRNFRLTLKAVPGEGERQNKTADREEEQHTLHAVLVGPFDPRIDRGQPRAKPVDQRGRGERRFAGPMGVAMPVGRDVIEDDGQNGHEPQTVNFRDIPAGSDDAFEIHSFTSRRLEALAAVPEFKGPAPHEQSLHSRGPAGDYHTRRFAPVSVGAVGP